MQRFLLQIPFSRPTPSEVAQLVVFAWAQVPRRRKDLFDGERQLGSILNTSSAREHAGFLVHPVDQIDEHIAADVFERDGQGVVLNRV